MGSLQAQSNSPFGSATYDFWRPQGYKAGRNEPVLQMVKPRCRKFRALHLKKKIEKTKKKDKFEIETQVFMTIVKSLTIFLLPSREGTLENQCWESFEISGTFVSGRYLLFKSTNDVKKLVRILFKSSTCYEA